MSAAMVRTATPGIYKRGGRYVVVYRAGGKQRKESARTLDEARRLKAARTTDDDRGEFHKQHRTTFHVYAREWIERYRGRGKRGFRESTRDDYRRLLDAYAFRFFDEKLRVSHVTPRRLAQFLDWLCEQQTPAGQALSNSTVRNAVNPVRACLSSATREGLLRANPALGLDLPHREKVSDDDDEQAKALTREQLAAFLALVHPRHRLLFRFLAATGLRISELFALQWRHLVLDGSNPCVRVRRALVRGRIQPPKTRHGRRDVPLSAGLVSELRARRRDSGAPSARSGASTSAAGETAASTSTGGSWRARRGCHS